MLKPIISGILVAVLLASGLSLYSLKKKQLAQIAKPSKATFWPIQSIDTMKFSRDVAREKLNDPTYDEEIETEVRNIANTGATHVAIATPYDEEFLPFLKRWVAAARKNNIKVWFRGNFSGWEGWFDYPKIDREKHKEMTRNFILSNPELFEDGDIFVSCPECENGGPGDPRINTDPESFRKFIIEEYTIVKESFEEIDKDVQGNYYSMNGDVTRLIMDEATTEALDGMIATDHYVRDTDKVLSDVVDMAEIGNGNIALGEWGAPIPDIHGNMTEEEQATWIGDLLEKAISEPTIVALNYWTNKGGSTAIWENDNTPRIAVDEITKYFSPRTVYGRVVDKYGNDVDNVIIETPHRSVLSDNGQYAVPLLSNENIKVSKEGYKDMEVVPGSHANDVELDLVMEPIKESLFDRILGPIK